MYSLCIKYFFLLYPFSYLCYLCSCCCCCCCCRCRVNHNYFWLMPNRDGGGCLLETAECPRPHPASLRPVGHFQLIEHVWTARIGALLLCCCCCCAWCCWWCCNGKRKAKETEIFYQLFNKFRNKMRQIVHAPGERCPF